MQKKTTELIKDFQHLKSDFEFFFVILFLL